MTQSERIGAGIITASVLLGSVVYFWPQIKAALGGGSTTIPAAPTLSYDPSLSGPTTVVFHMPAVSGVTGYDASNGQGYNVVNIKYPLGGLFHMVNAVPGVPVTLTVKACNSVGCSTATSAVGYTT